MINETDSSTPTPFLSVTTGSKEGAMKMLQHIKKIISEEITTSFSSKPVNTGSVAAHPAMKIQPNVTKYDEIFKFLQNDRFFPYAKYIQVDDKERKGNAILIKVKSTKETFDFLVNFQELPLIKENKKIVVEPNLVDKNVIPSQIKIEKPDHEDKKTQIISVDPQKAKTTFDNFALMIKNMGGRNGNAHKGSGHFDRIFLSETSFDDGYPRACIKHGVREKQTERTLSLLLKLGFDVDMSKNSKTMLVIRLSPGTDYVNMFSSADKNYEEYFPKLPFLKEEFKDFRKIPDDETLNVGNDNTKFNESLNDHQNPQTPELITPVVEPHELLVEPKTIAYQMICLSLSNATEEEKRIFFKTHGVSYFPSKEEVADEYVKNLMLKASTELQKEKTTWEENKTSWEDNQKRAIEINLRGILQEELTPGIKKILRDEVYDEVKKELLIEELTYIRRKMDAGYIVLKIEDGIKIKKNGDGKLHITNMLSAEDLLKELQNRI